MDTLLDRIREHNPDGISQSEAEQLFLWLYCTGDILPPVLRSKPPDREELASTFATLAMEGIIVSKNGSVSRLRTTKSAWAELIDDFLSDRISLDESFVGRSKSYLGRDGWPELRPVPQYREPDDL